MLANLRSGPLSGIKNTALLLDSCGLPRYWATVWSMFLPVDLAESTVRKKLSHIESFYQHSDEILGPGQLDDALAAFDLEALNAALEGFFFVIRNQSRTSPASEDRWQTTLRFVTEILQRVTRSQPDQESIWELHGRLERLELLHSKLHVGSRHRPEQIRSLPSEVVEFLYELLDPVSNVNPFRSAASRWRVFVLFILMLHQGLRRGEILLLPTDAIKTSFDRRLQENRSWITVKYNEYEDDQRYSMPGIKTASSIRQPPVSQMIALVLQEYTSSYRGRANHSFLLNSQKHRPMSTEGVTKIFQKVSSSLPKSLRSILQSQTGNESVTPHGLRHTCAVVRLNQFLAEGVAMDDALQRMRVFFGWSRDSDMPLRYARAVFEDRLASVWRDEFDVRISVLRSLPRRSS